MRGQRSTDQDLLEGLYRENCHRVYSFARSRLGESNATDITSEVFHAATIAIRDGKGDLVTTAWLLAVTRNKVYDHWRRAYRRKAKAHLIRGRREDRTEFPQDWHEDARRPAVVAALDAMSDRHRGLLILHHVDGMTIAELADVTGQTSAAIESALARARKRFRDLYRDGFDG